MTSSPAKCNFQKSFFKKMTLWLLKLCHIISLNFQPLTRFWYIYSCLMKVYAMKSFIAQYN